MSSYFVPALPLMLFASSSYGAGQAAPPAAPMQRVEISAPSGTEQRRNDTAGRISVTREDIARYGDVNVSALLKRQPGIAVVNGQVRMRGMGAGYTQILIDGEPAPPGFSVDSLATSMIERIDVMRNGLAEFGSQAIAGSINIIMRKNHAKPQRDVTLGLSTVRGYLITPSAALRWADQRGQLAWSMGVELSRPGFRFDETAYETDREMGRTQNQRETRTKGGIEIKKLSLSPRLSWKFGGGESLAWQATIDHSLQTTHAAATEQVLQGVPTTYPDNGFVMDLALTSIRSDVSWTRNIGPGRLVAKAGMSRYERKSDYLFTGAGGTATLARRVLSDALDDTVSLSGKYLAPLGSTHSLGVGWDGGRTLRTENRSQRDTTIAGEPLGVLDEDYKATVNRMALFVQDEWAVSAHLQAYLDLRWEGLQTDVEGRTMQRVQNQSSVFSPVAQMLWKLNDSGKDQVRIALSRTYKAPRTQLLVPRRYTTNNGNSATNPDVRGNPDLKPELAWGLDAGYEKSLGKDGMASVSGYVRRVQGVTVSEVDPDTRPWLSTPSNKDNAKVAGVEADLKYSPGSSVDLRANLGYNWSRLDAVPGPDNRLGDQVAVTANLGADWRASPAHTFGMNLNVQVGGPVRVSEQQRSFRDPIRNLDVYATWKVDDKTRWRLSASEALQGNWTSGQSYVSESASYQRRLVETSRVVIRLVLETRL